MGCAWCDAGLVTCPKESGEAVCSFESLPLERESIIVRLREEVAEYKREQLVLCNRREVLSKVESSFRHVVDLAAGMKMLAGVLTSRFGMSLEEVKRVCGFDGVKMSFRKKGALFLQASRLLRAGKITLNESKDEVFGQ